MRGLAERGHDLLFLERDVPWYADNRDLPESSLRPHGSIRKLTGTERPLVSVIFGTQISSLWDPMFRKAWLSANGSSRGQGDP